MQPLKVNLPWKMKDMRVDVKILTYPLLSEELPESTMFLVMRTFPLILLHMHHSYQPVMPQACMLLAIIQ